MLCYAVSGERLPIESVCQILNTQIRNHREMPNVRRQRESNSQSEQETDSSLVAAGEPHHDPGGRAADGGG